MANKSKPKTYQQMTDELNGLIGWFESDKVNLDEALGKYEQAMELIDQMENYLTSVGNKVKKITAKFDE